MNIKMPTLSRAVYILFSRHPEGIVLKQMEQYKEELTGIYNHLTNRTDIEALRQSINDLVLPGSESLNQKISRINAALKKAFPPEEVEQYLIRGKRGGPMKAERYVSLV